LLVAKSVKQPVVLPKKLASKAAADSIANSTAAGNDIPRDALSVINASIETIRARSANPTDAIRNLIRFEGTLSTAAFDIVEIAHTDFMVAAYDTATHQLNPQATQTVMGVIAALDTLYDYTKGYGDKQTFQNIIETALLEVVATGGVGMELVLNKLRMPDRLQLVAYDALSWVSRGDGTKYPKQRSARGVDIHLDIATFFVSELHKFANRPYATSMLEPAVNASYSFAGLLEEVRRSVRRSGHSRLIVSLDSDKVIAAAPTETRNDPEKLKKWMEDVKGSVESVVNDLEPDDALVTFDTAKAELLTASGEKADFVPLINAISGQLATSLKTSPSIIGLRVQGSQSLSNTESLVYLKIADSIRKPVEDVLSRALTLATRLAGQDVYVNFQFNPINLRPEDELEAFKSMRQARILEQLSEGFISDEKAALLLGTGPRPAGAPTLSGTGFARGSTKIDPTKASPNADPQGAALQPDTPSKAGGKSQ
jgi:hypothetical protein